MATIEITTNVGCTLACTFCPQDKISKLYKRGPDRMMTFESYKTILSKIPSNVRIDFSGYSEPFLNTEALRFIEYTALNGYQQVVYSTLMGVSTSDAYRLRELLQERKINFMVIHLPDSHGNMPGFKISSEYLLNLEILLESDNVSCMTMSKTNEILPAIKDYVRKNCSRKIYKKLPKNKFARGFMGWRRGGALDTSGINESYLLPSVRWSQPISCASTPFYDSNVVMPNGNVHLCCMDYGGKHTLGNLLIDTYQDLFKSKEMTKIISINRQCNYSEDTICRKCEDVLLHDYNYSGHGWNSFRPGHLTIKFEQFGFKAARARSLSKAARHILDFKTEVFKFIANRK
jgi:radical SAM protein with 4Fe4S-binding SPASM domain